MTPGAEHEEDRIHCRTVRHSRVVAAQRVLRPWRQKRFHLCPQSVRQTPAVITNPPSGRPQSSLLGHVLNMAMTALVAYWDRLLALSRGTSMKHFDCGGWKLRLCGRRLMSETRKMIVSVISEQCR